MYLFYKRHTLRGAYDWREYNIQSVFVYQLGPVRETHCIHECYHNIMLIHKNVTTMKYFITEHIIVESSLLRQFQVIF